MWFGTNSELNRYDGYEFKSFKHRVNGMPYSDEVVSKIIETQDGNLWVTYQNENISMYNPGEDQFYTQEEAFQMIGFQDAVYNVYASRDHQLIFTTRNDHNMYCYNYKSNEIFEIPVDTTEGFISDVYPYKESLYIIYSSGVVDIIQSLPYKRVARVKPFDKRHTSDKYRLFVDDDEDIWVYMGSKNSVGLYRYIRQLGDWIHYHTTSHPALSSQLVTSIVSGVDKKIWIGTDHGGINIFDKRTNQIEYLKNEFYRQLWWKQLIQVILEEQWVVQIS